MKAVTEHMGHQIACEKVVARTAYARNGNAHNPTKYYRWNARVDGRLVTSQRTRREALEIARDYIENELPKPAGDDEGGER